MKMKKKRAIKLFNALGFRTADKWSTKRLQDKIKNLLDIADGVKLKNKKAREVLSNVLATLKKGKRVRVYDPNEVKSDTKLDKDIKASQRREKEEKEQGEEKVSKKEKREVKRKQKEEQEEQRRQTVAKTKKKGKKKVAKDKKETDKKRNKFGTLLSTKAAKIDAALSSKKGRSMAQLIKRADVKGTFSNHMRVLVDGGHVKTKDGKYKLTK